MSLVVMQMDLTPNLAWGWGFHGTRILYAYLDNLWPTTVHKIVGRHTGIAYPIIITTNTVGCVFSRNNVKEQRIQ